MLAFVILSLTTSRYDTVDPQFFFLLYGMSGAFKTTIAKLLFNIHEGFYNIAPMNLTITTAAAMRKIGTQFRDCVCLYDDVAPSTNPIKKNEMEAKIDVMSRSTGDSTGYIKMDGKNEQSMKALGLSVVTAEYIPIENNSSVARTLIMKFDKKKVNLKRLAKAQNKRNIYPTVIINYIAYICENGEEYMEDLEDAFHKACKEFSFLSNVHSRTPYNAAWLYAGYKMFLKYANSVDSTIFKSDELKVFEKDLIELMQGQKEYMQNQDAVPLYINAINEMLSTGEIVLSQIIIAEEKRKIADKKTNMIGYIDEDYVYLLPDTAFSKVNSFLSKQGKVFPITRVTLNQLLADDKLIIPNDDKSGSKTVKLTINGMRLKVLRFKKNTFYK